MQTRSLSEGYKPFVFEKPHIAVLVRPTATTKGSSKYVCSKCGDNYTEEIGTTLKLLAIGNSFSQDAFEHLYIICKDASIENVILGNLYIGGCSLEKHYTKMSGDLADYTFYLSDSETQKMVSQGAATALTGIQYTDWDYITLQQNSAGSGLADTYSPYLENIIEYVKQNVTNDSFKLFWHMTWAYQGDETYDNFANYDYDQMKMYNGILNAVSTKILTNENFAGVVPAGTSIQNLRTSHLGDTLTRDGHHLSYGIGRYTAGLTYLAAITGIDISDITATPSSEVATHLDCIKDAVKKAIAKPYEITESAYPMPDEPDGILGTTLSPLTEEDKTYLTGLGLNADEYKVIDYDYTLYGYYNANVGSTIKYSATNTLNKQFLCANQIYSRYDITLGSVIRNTQTSSYQYRPEGWITLNEKVDSSARPARVTAETTIVDAAWWGDWGYRAFNIQTKSSSVTMTEDGATALRIYVKIA